MPGTSHQIRPVRATEIGPLADLAARSYADMFGDEYTPAQLRHELEANRSAAWFQRSFNRGDVILVDAEKGRLRGYVLITKLNFPETKPKPGDELLDRLYVDPDCQGQGIGRALLEAALAHPRLALAKRVYLQVRSQNQRALNLYHSAGFEVAGHTRLGVGNLQVNSDYIMMRPAKVPANVD